ncbi:hypothetical protein F4779DRAFT_327899 [Xylariaceae sp. FL0662B]|nr:hypothetical protein F4779DRAFT_327899 [Xylariaceae sp. FL0662B]
MMLRPAQLIARYRKFPRELFRVNGGPEVKLRAFEPARRNVYDIIVDKDGMVHPKALHPETYESPNGSAVRSNCPYLHSLIRHRFTGYNMVVYAVPKGTLLPEDLLLVHERPHQYSIQPAEPMTIDDLNEKITQFLVKHAKAYDQDQFLEAYPKATETSKVQAFKTKYLSFRDPDID